MYSMVGLLVIAFLTNALIRPVAGHHNVEKTHPEAQTQRRFSRRIARGVKPISHLHATGILSASLSEYLWIRQ